VAARRDNAREQLSTCRNKMLCNLLRCVWRENEHGEIEQAVAETERPVQDGEQLTSYDGVVWIVGTPP